MQIVFVTFASLILLLSCVGTSPTQEADENELITRLNTLTENYVFHGPEGLIRLIDESSVKYNIDLGDRARDPWIDFASIESSAETVSSFTSRIRLSDGSYTLFTREPKGKILELFDKAANEMALEHYKICIALYREALALDATYFKTWKNLANCYYLMRDYKTAIDYLNKAIALNNIGYEEYWSLADAYLANGDRRMALQSIAHAMIYNKNSPEFLESLGNILVANNLSMKQTRMIFPFEFRKLSDKECVVTLLDPGGVNWFSMALAYAVWQMEPEQKKIDGLFGELGVVNKLKYREIILNEVAYIDSIIRGGKVYSAEEGTLYSIYTDGLVEEMIYWELIASKIPKTMLVLPDRAIDKIMIYIMKYVFVEKDKGSPGFLDDALTARL